MTDPKEQQAAKIAQLLKQAMEEFNTPMFHEQMRFLALHRMAKYQAHIKVGFTPEQSLELCK